MLSSKVDLTENREFGGGGAITLSSDFFIRPMFNGSRITEEDYKDTLSHDNFFGRRKHYSEFDAVFDISLRNLLKEEEHCLHCNKILKEPWNIDHHCCNDCARELMLSGSRFRFSIKKFPWEIISNHPVPTDDSSILNMR